MGAGPRLDGRLREGGSNDSMLKCTFVNDEIRGDRSAWKVDNCSVLVAMSNVAINAPACIYIDLVEPIDLAAYTVVLSRQPMQMVRWVEGPCTTAVGSRRWSSTR